MIMDIHPTKDQMLRAVIATADRIVTSSKANLPHDLSVSRSMLDRLPQEFLGVLAEIVIAENIFHVPWEEGLFTFHHRPDVLGVEVRATRHEDGCLIFRPGLPPLTPGGPERSADPRDRPFLLLTARKCERHGPQCVRLIYRGWLWGYECERPEWLRAGGRPAYFVPPSALHGTETLADALGGAGGVSP